MRDLVGRREGSAPKALPRQSPAARLRKQQTRLRADGQRAQTTQALAQVREA